MEAQAFHCPRWAELPGIPLYMDQVLFVVNAALAPVTPNGESVTSTMINNYVKQKLLSAPVRKKYDREHLATLLMICTLKRILSISEIAALFARLNDGPACAGPARYDLFCAELEAALSGSDSPAPQNDGEAALHAAMCAFANKLAVQTMLYAGAARESEG